MCKIILSGKFLGTIFVTCLTVLAGSDPDRIGYPCYHIANNEFSQVKSYEDFSPEVIYKKLEILIDWPTPDPRHPLVEFLCINFSSIQKTLCSFLKDPKTSPRIRAWLASFPKFLDKENIKIISPDFQQALITALQDKYWRVRANSSYSLGRLNQTSALIFLLDLRDHDPEMLVRNSAKYAVQAMGGGNIEENNETPITYTLKQINDNFSLNYPEKTSYFIHQDISAEFGHQMLFFVENISHTYHNKFSQLFETSPHPIPPTEIHVFPSRSKFLQHIQKEKNSPLFLQDTLAYYVPHENKMVTSLFLPSIDFLSTVGHETCHRILRQYIPHPPLWLDEGFAEYYSDVLIQNPITSSTRKKYIHTLEVALMEGTIVPLSELVELDYIGFRNDFGIQESIHYAESWSFIDFLHNSKEPKVQAILHDYCKKLKNEKHTFSSFPRGHLEEILLIHDFTFDRLQTHWQAYILDLIQKNK